MDEIVKTLRTIYQGRLPDFSGVGIIVCNNLENLPILNLRNSPPVFGGIKVATFLRKISSEASEYHDGFHVISTKLKILRVSQYFSPPINEEISIDRSRRIGGRYVAALFGSDIDSVVYCGIVSVSGELSIFEKGIEVFHENLKC